MFSILIVCNCCGLSLLLSTKNLPPAAERPCPDPSYAVPLPSLLPPACSLRGVIVSYRAFTASWLLTPKVQSLQ